MRDYDTKNELATKLLREDVSGSLIFVKVSRTNIVSIDITDLPELMEDSLMSGINAMTMSSDICLMQNNSIEKTTSDPSIVESTTDDEYDSECAMYDADDYYKYYAGYDSY